MRWPSSILACKSASSEGSLSDGPSGRFNLQLKLFTEEMVPSVNGCLNPYMFFPLMEGVKSPFSDPFTEPSTSLAVFAGSIVLGRLFFGVF